jgi:hypothetical protein
MLMSLIFVPLNGIGNLANVEVVSPTVPVLTTILSINAFSASGGLLAEKVNVLCEVKVATVKIE